MYRTHLCSYVPLEWRADRVDPERRRRCCGHCLRWRWGHGDTSHWGRWCTHWTQSWCDRSCSASLWSLCAHYRTRKHRETDFIAVSSQTFSSLTIDIRADTRLNILFLLSCHFILFTVLINYVKRNLIMIWTNCHSMGPEKIETSLNNVTNDLNGLFVCF